MTRQSYTYDEYRAKAKDYYDATESITETLGKTADGDGDLAQELVSITLTGTEVARAAAALVGLAVGPMQDIAKIKDDYRGAVEALETADLFRRAFVEAQTNLTTNTEA